MLGPSEMLIDAHQHVCWRGRDARGLVAEMDAHGIDLAWLLTWYLPPAEDDRTYHRVASPLGRRGDGTHAAMTLEPILAARDRYPDRFIAGYCPPPTDPTAPECFEAAYHMHHVRVCGEWSYRTPLDDPRSINLFRKAGELGCPVVLHMDVPFLSDGAGGRRFEPRWYGGGAAPLERALQACPATTFIGHCPGFWREISGDADEDPAVRPAGRVVPGGRIARLFDEYPHLYADLSAGSGLNALRRDLDHARAFLERYADRLLYGRDQYGDELIRLLAELDLDDATRRMVYSDNARRLVPPPALSSRPS